MRIDTSHAAHVDPAIVLRTTPVPTRPSRVGDGLCWAQVVVSGAALFAVAALLAGLQFGLASATRVVPALPGGPVLVDPVLW